MSEQASYRQNSLKESLGDDWEDIVQEAKMKCLQYQDNSEYNRILTRVIHNLALNALDARETEDGIKREERNELLVAAAGMSEGTYNPDFGAIADVQRILRKHWNGPERDAIFLYLTKQVSLRDLQGDLGKSTTDTHRFMVDSLALLKAELRDYA